MTSSRGYRGNYDWAMHMTSSRRLDTLNLQALFDTPERRYDYVNIRRGFARVWVTIPPAPPGFWQGDVKLANAMLGERERRECPFCHDQRRC
jgi:hypothetical protein